MSDGAGLNESLNPVPLFGAPLLMKAGAGRWGVPSTTSYGTEAELRNLIAENPSIIPGVGDPAAAAVTEFGIPGVGRADVVVVESSGAVTVCEAKLANNADIRRTVIGQVMAYAAGLARMDIDAFEQSWAARSAGGSLLDILLGADATDDDRSALRGFIGATLESGRFRLLLVVDSLTDELRLIVGYMAAHLDVQVIALELAYASHGGVEVLVPRTWGTEIGSLDHAEPRRRVGRTAEIADVLDSITIAADTAAVAFGGVVRTVLSTLGSRVDYVYSGVADMVDPVLVVKGPPVRQPAKIITTQSVPGVRVCFDWCRKLPIERREAALAVLERHPLLAPVFAGVRDVQFKRRPLVPYTGALDQPGTVETVIEALQLLSE